MRTKNDYLIPLAIVVAGGVIGGALYFAGGPGVAAVTNPADSQPVAQQPQPEGSTDAVRAVTDTDHIKGNPDAPIKIVEYSDFECPFCQRFHDTMNEVLADEANSDVAWVFRHFPLDQLHPVKARAVAVASECAAEQGGDEAFWKFTDGYFTVTLTNNQTDIETVIPQLIQEAGLNQSEFQTCFESGKYDERIEADIQNAITTGGRGTPWSIVIAPNGKTFPINGAQPKQAVEQLIEMARSEK